MTASLKDASGVAPVEAQGIEFVAGRQGRAALIQRPAVLTYPTKSFNPNQFTISFWVRHEQPLEDYFFQQLVYFYHETPDLKNRIGILKRSGTNYFVFFFGDDQGSAKGVNFADDWFAMATAPQAWAAGSWHHLVCTADKSRGLAQFFIDGQKVAEARGTQFPAKLGEVFWIGTQQGHSWMRGAIDELVIEPVARLNDAPLAPPPAKPAAPLPAAKPVLGKSVGQLTGKDLAINLDFFDICIGTDCWDLRHCDAEMDRLMALCAHFGFDRVYFRVSVCGAECYHTKVMTPAFEEVFQGYTKEGLDTLLRQHPLAARPHGRGDAGHRSLGGVRQARSQTRDEGLSGGDHLRQPLLRAADRVLPEAPGVHLGEPRREETHPRRAVLRLSRGPQVPRRADAGTVRATASTASSSARGPTRRGRAATRAAETKARGDTGSTSRSSRSISAATARTRGKPSRTASTSCASCNSRAISSRSSSAK